MATLAGITLTWPGTRLDRIWELNPRAYRQLAPIGALAGIGFLVLGGVLLASAIGWMRRRLWGWRLTVGIIATQALGDLVNAIRGDVPGGVVGCVIAGTLLGYLLRPGVRRVFGRGLETRG